MKYLDERITFQVQVGTRVQDLPEKGIYTYAIIAKDYDGYEDTAFVGNFYYDKKFYQTLDVTDIIRNMAPTHKALAQDLHNPYSLSLSGQSYGWTIDEYWVELRMTKDGSTITKTSDHELVANVYRYPNRSKYANLSGGSQFYNYNLSAFQNSYYLLLQGWKYGQYSQGAWDRLALVPRYPCKSTENYGWSVTFGHGYNVHEINLQIGDTIGDYDDEIALDCDLQGAPLYSNTWVSSLGSLLEQYMYEVEEHQATFGDVEIYAYNSTTQTSYLISTFESCYSRYYLQWLDRFGCVQSQPFRENLTYSEDLDKEEVVTYEDKRRISHVSVQPKWKIYSGWIKDELYPYYESIFTSPFVILYDTTTDMNYEVIIKDKYTEKNYKNQKGLVNLELNLEAAEKQNITY